MKLTSPEKSQECYEAGIRIDTLRGEIDWGRNRNRASLDEWLDWFHEKLKSNDRKRKYVLLSSAQSSAQYIDEKDEFQNLNGLMFNDNICDACGDMALWLVREGIIDLEKE